MRLPKVEPSFDELCSESDELVGGPVDFAAFPVGCWTVIRSNNPRSVLNESCAGALTSWSTAPTRRTTAGRLGKMPHAHGGGRVIMLWVSELPDSCRLLPFCR